MYTWVPYLYKCRGITGVDIFVFAAEYENSVRIPGDPIYLHCDTHCPSDFVLWYHGDDVVNIDNVKYFLTKDQGIIIFNVTSSDGRAYYCKDSSTGVELAKHVINLHREYADACICDIVNAESDIFYKNP